MTPDAIEAAARALHRFNAPRVANDVEPWESVPPHAQGRWRRQAELALLAAEETVVPLARDPFAQLSRPNIERPVTLDEVVAQVDGVIKQVLHAIDHDDDVTKVERPSGENGG